MPTVGSQGLTFVGDRALIRTLHVLGPRVERRVLSQALNAAMAPIVTAARQNARKLGTKETGKAKRWRKAFAKAGFAKYRLTETIGKVSRTYAGKRMVVAGPIYGAKYGHKGNIGHLVESGHKKVLFGRRTGGRVPGYLFMKPAWDANIGRAQAILVAKVRMGIEREAVKARVI